MKQRRSPTNKNRDRGKSMAPKSQRETSVSVQKKIHPSRSKRHEDAEDKKPEIRSSVGLGKMSMLYSKRQVAPPESLPHIFDRNMHKPSGEPKMDKQGNRAASRKIFKSSTLVVTPTSKNNLPSPTQLSLHKDEINRNSSIHYYVERCY